ncbi:MAG: hypothetical protein ABJF10_16600 [Chthoniobacter sp.]|uniref:hypothetical protein n=1 Tax=Chthoniobacter sp. TaxID=2510640 RepID=UPI0032AD8262
MKSTRLARDLVLNGVALFATFMLLFCVFVPSIAFLEIGGLLSGSIAAGARIGYMAALPCIAFIAWRTGNVVLAGIFVLMVALAIAGALAANWHSITG